MSVDSKEKLEQIPSAHGSLSSAEHALIDEKEIEKRVWRKLDFYVVPIVTMYYLLSFLDRVNLGNARVAGLQKSLNMTNHQYSVALTVTYVPYIAAELPANLLLKTVGANYMLPAMVIAWGLATAMQGVVTTYKGLLICRAFLGLAEGGLFPGLVFYLSFFYPRHRLQGRISLFFVGSSLAAAFSGLLAFGIVNLDGVSGRPGWAWIFILEGIFTSVFGIISYPFLPRSVAHTRFLSVEEANYVMKVLKADGAIVDDDSDKFSWSEVGRAFTLPHVWILGIIFFCGGTILYSLAYFTPSIIQTLGYTPTRSQLMSVPPVAFAFILCTLGSWISDKYHCRGLMTIASLLFVATGFGMFLGSKEKSIRYASLFFSSSGAYLASPSLCTWSANNVHPHTRRGTAIAFGFIMTNAGGILATWLLGSLSKAPDYRKGTLILLIFAIVIVVLSAANIWYLHSENKRKEEIRRTTRREDEAPGLGDKSAWFTYVL